MKEILNLIVIILLILLLVIILDGVTSYTKEIKIIWYWIIGLITMSGVLFLILIKK